MVHAELEAAHGVGIEGDLVAGLERRRIDDLDVVKDQGRLDSLTSETVWKVSRNVNSGPVGRLVATTELPELSAWKRTWPRSLLVIGSTET